MDFTLSQAQRHWLERVRAFIADEILPADAAVKAERAASRDPSPTMEKLKAGAREKGLWNLFLPPSPEHDTDEYCGAGLTNLDYALCAEEMGRVGIASECFNCSAPDTGNMEVLHRYGSDAQKARWLRPLMAGEIRSAFLMTEPDVASSDATNITTSIRREGDEYVINGTKWWASGAADPRCAIFIVMGKTDPEASTHRQQSMVLVPRDTPGVQVTRALPVFGYWDQHGHVELEFTDVRVPASNLIGEEGSGFAIAQARLGPGRIHHCMRSLGLAERALELMCQRSVSRVAFGKPLARQGTIQETIAEARMAIEQARLLTMKAAWMIDTVGAKGARAEIAAIKVIAPRVALKVVDDAIQVHGGAGVSDDFPLAAMWAGLRTLRIADGPDAVHLRSVALVELSRYVSR